MIDLWMGEAGERDLGAAQVWMIGPYSGLQVLCGRAVCGACLVDLSFGLKGRSEFQISTADIAGKCSGLCIRLKKNQRPSCIRFCRSRARGGQLHGCAAEQ